MNRSKAWSLGLLNSSKALASIIIIVALAITSAAAAVTLTGQGASDRTASAGPTIVSMQADTDEAYVDQIVAWQVLASADLNGGQDSGLLITWDWDDGSYTVVHVEYTVDNSIVTDAETHAWCEPGTYEVVVSVWDGYKTESNTVHNVSAATTLTVLPIESNTPPVASFYIEPAEGTVDTLFTFDASSSFDLEDPLESISVRWDWESDGVWDTPYSLARIAEHQFSEAGTYTVTLEVMDEGDMVDQTAREVTVISSPVLSAHDPIVIIGDDDFVPENGVIGGAGTYQSPYIIGGWDILPTEGNGITVQGTTKYFTICDTRITGSIDTCMYGVYLELVDHATLRGLNVSGFWMGIHAKLTADLTVTACQVTWSSWGLFALRCGSISVTENEISHNIVGTGNHEGIMVQETDYACIALNNLVDNWDGVFMYLVSDGYVFNNTMSENAVGIQALYSRCLVFGNSISSRHVGVVLVGCPDTNVEANKVMTSPSVSDSYSGISFMSCSNLYVSCNVVDSYDYGIGTDYGYEEHPDSENVTVSWNKISNCSGSGMRVSDVSGLTVTANAFLSNGIGIYVYPSASEVRIYHNDFLYNQVQVIEDPLCIGNEWDDGYPSGGNFWSDYQGTDEYSGVDQTEPGPDGIGDTPYVMTLGSQDDYPLMEPSVTEPTNAMPTADFTVYPESGTVETVFEFDASSSWDLEDASSGLEVRWDWESDGVWDTDWTTVKSATHAFGAAGTYVVALEVRDSGGLTDTTLRDVTVLGPVVLTPHDPILIEGDAAFTAENGVIGGNGTSDDPYVIAGWDIDASTAIGISIKGTTASYVLRDMSIHSGTTVQPYLHEGIRIDSASNGRVERIVTWDNTIDLDIRDSSNMVIVDNDLTNDFSGGISLLLCNEVEITNNMITTHGNGIAVMYTSAIKAVGNTFRAGGFCFYGSSAAHFDTHTITPDNTVAGEPILYFAHEDGLELNAVQAAQVIIVSSQSVTLSGLDLSGVQQGLVLAYVTSAVVQGCHFESNLENCIKLYYCTEVTIQGNLIYDSLYYAIETISSSYVRIADNIVRGSSYGIVIRFYSPGTVIESNTAYDNFAAVLLYEASGRVYVSENNLSDNDIGIFMVGTTGSTIVGNRIAMNAHEGIRMESGSVSNLIYHNNMISNYVQVVEEYAGANTWDNGYPSGGNYWDDYIGVDHLSGPDQDEGGSDGIGDNPYVLDSGSVDRYPLMIPYTPPTGL